MYKIDLKSKESWRKIIFFSFISLKMLIILFILLLSNPFIMRNMKFYICKITI